MELVTLNQKCLHIVFDLDSAMPLHPMNNRELRGGSLGDDLMAFAVIESTWISGQVVKQLRSSFREAWAQNWQLDSKTDKTETNGHSIEQLRPSGNLCELRLTTAYMLAT